MPFGKHKGQKLKHVPTAYLAWFMERDWSMKWLPLRIYADERVVAKEHSGDPSEDFDPFEDDEERNGEYN